MIFSVDENKVNLEELEDQNFSDFGISEKDDIEKWVVKKPRLLGEELLIITTEDEFWQAEVTGKAGRSNNIEWKHDGNTYSFTGLTKEIIRKLVGDVGRLNGNKYWVHPKYNYKTISKLRNEGATREDKEK